jgi:hypothetical protein
VRRLVLALVSLLLAGALSACGASTHTSTTGNTAPAQAQIKTAFVKFFSNKTPLEQRVALLQNGAQFKPVIEALAKNPLASNTSATVKSVKLQGGNQASVVYTVYVGGTPLPQLKNRTGTAVKVNGKWLVGDASFCSLVSIGGSVPAVCKHAT